MPSIVWGRDPQEAYEEPYEYEAQEQFAREAQEVLDSAYRALGSQDRFRFTRDERSKEKAVWLLAVDALDSLKASLRALDRREHRIAGKSFRDIMETMDLAALFASDSPKSRGLLARWYEGHVVPHRHYRSHLQATGGEEAAASLTMHYHRLSRFTHRSYFALMDGYSLGAGDRLVHDAWGELPGSAATSATFLVLPHTISAYYATLASVIVEYLTRLSAVGLLTPEQRDALLNGGLEVDTMPRRFLPRRWVLAGPKKDPEKTPNSGE